MRGLVLVALSIGCSAPAADIPPGELPCDVAAVICSRCTHCHSDPPQHHAPFPLVTWADVDAPYGTKGLRRWQRMEVVIEAGAIPHMPPLASPTGQPDEQELAVLRAWFEAGAPPAPVGGGCDDCMGTIDAAPLPIDATPIDAGPPID